MELSAKSSNNINILKCVLCVGVVVVHAQINLGNAHLLGGLKWSEVTEYHYFSLFQTFFVSYFCDQVCVPIFFILSGFLFFLKPPEVFKIKWFLNKYKSRVQSLLIPYLIANAIFIISSVIYDIYRGNTDVDILNVLKGFWAKEKGYPADLPLWFMRDLIMVVFFTPLIYICNKKLSFILPFLFGLWFICDYLHIIGISSRAFFFFSVGAWFSIKGIDLIEKLQNDWMIPIYWAVYFIVFVFFMYCDQEYILRLSVIPACAALVATVMRLTRRILNIPRSFIVSTVFIYLYHYYVVMIVWRLLLILFGTSEPAIFAGFFFGVVITIVLLYLLYLFIYKLFPKITSIIVGGR